jgi:hypothetical protein
MSDRLFFAIAALVAAALVALALVWPQGYGRRSPWPFGGPVRTSEAVKAEPSKAQPKPASAAKAAPSAPGVVR